jgi:DNA-directed RNA polymerase, beta' subunit
MAVHVPISEQALLEARELMLANKNILGPKDGEPIINPSQDMVLGIYYLTIEQENALGEGKVFNDFDHMLRAYEAKKVSLHARVALPLAKVKSLKLFNQSSKPQYIISTVGKFIFNNIFPESFPFIFNNEVGKSPSLDDYNNTIAPYIVPAGTDIVKYIKTLPLLSAFNKKNIARIIRHVFDKYVAIVNLQSVATIIDKLNDIELSNVLLEYFNLDAYDGKKINREHAILLGAFTQQETEKTLAASRDRTLNNADIPLSPKEKAEILDKV